MIFLPAFFRCRAKTMSSVRVKKPISFFQLIPHLQCCNPINCCFIFLPQFGQILLLFPMLFLFQKTNFLFIHKMCCIPSFNFRFPAFTKSEWDHRFMPLPVFFLYSPLFIITERRCPLVILCKHSHLVHDK